MSLPHGASKEIICREMSVELVMIRQFSRAVINVLKIIFSLTLLGIVAGLRKIFSWPKGVRTGIKLMLHVNMINAALTAI